MGVLGKLETNVEIKASAEKFHEMFKSRPHHVTNACPEKVQCCQLLEGDWGTEGSIISWNYVFDGKPSFAKEIIEEIDEKKNVVSFKVIEGDLLEQHKNFKITLQVSPKGDGSIVRWTIEYEKKHEKVPECHGLLPYFIAISKDVDTLLCVP